ncbi:hypothetical protein L7F22_057813 [Adiantum nelumboides]|nr:hypothetical protein [Adiantum nelumboides]
MAAAAVGDGEATALFEAEVRSWLAWCRALPKVELHAHLNGSVRSSTLVELASGLGEKGLINFPEVQAIILKGNRSLAECFKLFDLIHLLTTDHNIITRITKEVVEDFAAENVVYLELRTTPKNTDEAYRKIKLALEKTQSKQKKAADRHRRELVFSLGDWARLRKMKGKERLFPKLGMRYYGPFQICDKISNVAYRMKIPEGWKIHNAFHVSLLRPFVGDMPEDMVPEEQLEVEELDEIHVPEQILAHKDRKVARRYLVKFKNYSPMDAKWMEEAELVDSPQFLQLYLEAFQLQPTVT